MLTPEIQNQLIQNMFGDSDAEEKDVRKYARKVLSVGDLLEQLRTFDPGMPVLLECYDSAAANSISSVSGYALEVVTMEFDEPTQVRGLKAAMIQTCTAEILGEGLQHIFGDGEH